MDKRNLNIMHLAALLILSWLALAANAQAAAAGDDIERIFSVEPAGTLYIDSDSGAIEVSTWDRDEVRVRVRNTNNFEIEVEQEGNDITVYADSQRGFFRRGNNSIRFSADVPRNFNVNLDTGGGAISVASISGDVVADTSGGPIDIGDVDGGDVEADTSGGAITIGNVNGSVAADTSGGRIRIGDVSGDVEADTSGGSINIGNVGGDILADTSGGSIEVGTSGGEMELDTSGGTIRAGFADGPVLADTSGGNIYLDGSAVRVEADTSGGNVEIQRSGGAVYAGSSGGNIVIRQAVGPIIADTAGGRIDAELAGYTDDRDATVELETAGGDVVVRIPANHQASVLADLEVTRRGRGDYRIVSDFDLDIGEDNNGNIHARGDINGGGDIIYLETTNSDISILATGN